MPDHSITENIAIISQAVGVIAACWAIISGIDAWKREYIGKKRIDVAEETLISFLELKDAISFIRNPFSNTEEGNSRKKRETETEAETELLNRGYIVFERYEKRKDVFIRFNTLKYRYMAVFGIDKASIFEETNRSLNSIFAAARMLATYYWPRQGRVHMTEEEFRKHLEEMNNQEGIFWETTLNDKVNQQLDCIQEQLINVLKPLLDESMKTYKLSIKNLFDSK
jgi:hypothetical protein